MVVYVPHTTAGVTINEHVDPALVSDVEDALERVVGDEWPWRHDDQDGPNAPSHVRASLMGHSVVDPAARRRLARARNLAGDLLLRVRRATRPHGLRQRAAVIEVEALTKRFGSTLAVDDLSFSVEPGRVTGFLGPNGAGQVDHDAGDPRARAADGRARVRPRRAVPGAGPAGAPGRRPARDLRRASRPLRPQSPARARAGRRHSDARASTRCSRSSTFARPASGE